MVLATCAALDHVGKGSCSGGHGAEEQVKSADGLLVPVVGFGEVGVDVADELAALVPAELVEVFVEGHAHRVTPTSLAEIACDVWSGLSDAHRLFFQVATVLGCLLFLIVGAVLR